MEAYNPLGTGRDFHRAAHHLWRQWKGTAEPNRSVRTCGFCLARLASITQPSCCPAEPVAALNALGSRCLGQIVFPCLLSAPSQFRFELQLSL